MTTTDTSGTSPDSNPKDVAREQAGQVGGKAGEQAGHVAQTTKDQAQEVMSEASSQARNLAGEFRTQMDEQAGAQRDRLVEMLRSVSDELEQMVRGEGGQSGMASDLAQKLAGRSRDVASSMDGKEPGDLLHEVQAVARKRPGAFLVGAAVAGVLAGRLTSGAKAAHGEDASSTPVYPATGVDETEGEAVYPYNDDLGAVPASSGRGTSATPLAATGTAPANVVDADVDAVGTRRGAGYGQGPGL